MKAWIALAVLGVSNFGLWAGQAQAPQPPSAKPQAVEATETQTRIILDVTRVNMLFTVTDKKGRFITNLGSDDFEVFEGKNPQNIQEFTAETDLPLRLAILIDTSNSIRDRFKFEQEAAIEFINSVVRPRQDKAMVVSFDTSAELVADLTDDTEKLAKRIRDLRPGGGTALYDAIFFACRDKLHAGPAAAQVPPRHRHRERRRRQPEPRTRATRRSKWRRRPTWCIYTISTNITRTETDGDKVLKYLTVGDRRPGVLPVQGGGPGAVVREHRQRTAPPVQHLLPARAAQDRRPVPRGRR